MRPVYAGISLATLLAIVALILAILAIAGLYTPLLLTEIAVVLLALAMLL
jgi:hypothetical protein